MATRHDCPVRGCDRSVRREHLMCSPHWFSVSAPTRHRVYREYKAGPLSEAHVAAMLDAIDEVNAKVAV